MLPIKNWYVPNTDRRNRDIEQADHREGVGRRQGVRRRGVVSGVDGKVGLPDEGDEVWRDWLGHQDAVGGVDLRLAVVRSGFGDRAYDVVGRRRAVGVGRSRLDKGSRPADQRVISVEAVIVDGRPVPHDGHLVDIDGSGCRIDRINLR